MKTYFITGGAGFIGSTLTERLLKEGNKVVTIDNFCDYYDPKIKEKNIKDFINNDNYKLYRGDIRNREDVKKVFDENHIDVVMHLAAMAGVRPSSVYGNCKVVPFREDMIVDYAISPYAATKKANEVMAHVYHKLNDMNIIMLRFFTVYGPKQRPDLAINKFTRLMFDGKSIPMYGDGSTSRDYTYVDDIVDGICKSCDYVMNNDNVYEIINLGSNNPISLKDMINVIGDVLRVTPSIDTLPMQPGDVDRTYADISKAKKLLGYEPKTSFKEGIKNFINWYKNNNI